MVTRAAPWRVRAYHGAARLPDRRPPPTRGSLMTPTRALAVGLAVLALAAPARADETPAASKIVAVDLFKNGLAVVKREVTLGKPGVYALDDVPVAIHGTYFVEAAGPVETVAKMRA